ncbi:hypothetical protein AW736_24220 [Termitidicoccus mucosus]|uniref:HTH iclR-type domain-containing protein n=1 Tax=Termitidicoccus mucosus TaxID=1184151 RepID=A0A178IAZ5_9BACT|nr:hypothetical protein AW736_24220 [Opitutaceae bacterium TSB47]
MERTLSKPTDAQRRHRIAELLCQAIHLAEASDALRARLSEKEAEELGLIGDTPDAASPEDRVFQYLASMRAASPAAICSGTGLSRASVQRALQRLARERQIVVEGQTRSVVYHLNRMEPDAAQLERN